LDFQSLDPQIPFLSVSDLGEAEQWGSEPP
jgi:hypothetical protein